MATAQASAKKNSISLKDKLQIILRIEKGEKQTDVCQTLSLPKTTVNTIWRKRETFKRQYESSEICGDAKRSRTSSNKDVDAALLEWFKQARSNNVRSAGLFYWPKRIRWRRRWVTQRLKRQQDL